MPKKDQFQKDKPIGHSSYGMVYSGFHNETKERVGIKLYDENKGNPATTRQVAMEVSSLRNVYGSRYVVNMLDYKVSERGVHEVVIQDILGMRRLKHYPVMELSPVNIKRILYQLLKGVEHIHSKGVIHRALTPAHIYFDETLVKITHFSESDQLGFTRTGNSHSLTLNYTSPELFLGEENYTTAVDIWSLGCVFGKLALGEELFRDGSEEDDRSLKSDISDRSQGCYIKSVIRLLGPIRPKSWEGVELLPEWPFWQTIMQKNTQVEDIQMCFNEVRLPYVGLDLLLSMLVYDPSERITAKRALEHKYFAELVKKHLL